MLVVLVSCGLTGIHSKRPGRGSSLIGSKLYLHEPNMNVSMKQKPGLAYALRICQVRKGNVSRMSIPNLSMNRLWSLCSNPDRKSSTSAGDGGSNKRRRTGLKCFRTRLVPFLTGSRQTAGGISLVLFPGWGGGVLGLLSTLGATTSSISGCWISSISFCNWACSWERLLHDRKDKWGFRNLRE